MVMDKYIYLNLSQWSVHANTTLPFTAVSGKQTYSCVLLLKLLNVISYDMGLQTHGPGKDDSKAFPDCPEVTAVKAHCSKATGARFLRPRCFTEVSLKAEKHLRVRTLPSTSVSKGFGL